MIPQRKNYLPIKQLLYLVALITIISCTTDNYKLKTATDQNGYVYEYVTGDPLKARIYKLENGLKVYLSYNSEEPRVATLIGVRAGSTSDPVETTGLAHYFEHLMFKGTTRIGALDWENEKIYLDQISEN
jgi:predicted Zn-dependent peptidase